MERNRLLLLLLLKERVSDSLESLRGDVQNKSKQLSGARGEKPALCESKHGAYSLARVKTARGDLGLIPGASGDGEAEMQERRKINRLGKGQKRGRRVEEPEVWVRRPVEDAASSSF